MSATPSSCARRHVVAGRGCPAPEGSAPLEIHRAGSVLSGSPGFTLIEIAVVLFIMGLIMGLALPYFGGLGGAELKSQVRRLAGRVNYLYDESTEQKVVLRLTFDLDSNCYFVSRLDPYVLQPGFTPEHGLAGGIFMIPAGVRLRDVSVEGAGTFRRGMVSSVFYPAGYVDATVVHLTDDAGEVFTVAIDPLTGRVAITRGDVSPAAAIALSQ
jgi:prepilin-type N-terminal cleavage/methylation domain-containing protein